MGWNLPPGCTDKDIDDAAPQNEPDDESEITELTKDIMRMGNVLIDCLDYFEQLIDADCVGDPPRYVPNEEMRLARAIKDALTKLCIK